MIKIGKRTPNAAKLKRTKKPNHSSSKSHLRRRKKLKVKRLKNSLKFIDATSAENSLKADRN